VWRGLDEGKRRVYSNLRESQYKKMVPPHGTTKCGKIHIKQLLTTVKFEFVARVPLKLWHTSPSIFSRVGIVTGRIDSGGSIERQILSTKRNGRENTPASYNVAL